MLDQHDHGDEPDNGQRKLESIHDSIITDASMTVKSEPNDHAYRQEVEHRSGGSP